MAKNLKTSSDFLTESRERSQKQSRHFLSPDQLDDWDRGFPPDEVYQLPSGRFTDSTRAYLYGLMQVQNVLRHVLGIEHQESGRSIFDKTPDWSEGAEKTKKQQKKEMKALRHFYENIDALKAEAESLNAYWDRKRRFERLLEDGAVQLEKEPPSKGRGAFNRHDVK